MYRSVATMSNGKYDGNWITNNFWRGQRYFQIKCSKIHARWLFLLCNLNWSSSIIKNLILLLDVLSPAHKKYEAQGHVDRELWNRLGEQGYLGVSIPAEVGGIGGTFKDEAIILEEQSYAHCHAPAITVSSFKEKYCKIFELRKNL